jgi:uncharacterized cupredoxin-like copper-binding protein
MALLRIALAAGLAVGSILLSFAPRATAQTTHAHTHGAAAGHHHDHGGVAHGATRTDGGPGNPADVKRTVRIETHEHKFNAKQIQVRAGETVRFVITNVSYEPHEFGIASPQEHAEHRAMMKQMPNMAHDDANVVTVMPGETKELIWRFGKDRNLEFACNIPGHAEHGMAGTFRVAQ